jgi:hypothetical protein
MPTVFADYYRCPSDIVSIDVLGELSAEPKYFSFHQAVGFGRLAASGQLGPDSRPDVTSLAESRDGTAKLPFDLDEVVNNLRFEQYPSALDAHRQMSEGGGASRTIYYLLRPLLPVPVRKHLQRLRLSGWDRIEHPRWPVDVSVETLMEQTMALVLRSSGREAVPFIWFWPDGAHSCAMMTHDVEEQAGLDFCGALMDLNDEYGVKSSFQLVPEVRYPVPQSAIDAIRRRGFEVNVHDLNHDGQLFSNRQVFLERVDRINRYRRDFGAQGFRAGAMYRQQAWFDRFEFSYDMSVPNVAHLEPQRGGCCTVMPYFVGRVLELPLTMLQDYSLFNIIGEYSTTRWQEQIELVRAKHGLMSFIAHPDYLIDKEARCTYASLLAILRDLRENGNTWVPLPRDVDQWWRARSEMRLVRAGQAWRIEGPEAHRARIAYARLEQGRLNYEVENIASFA